MCGDRPDVQVITANPKTAGVARWNFLALWGHRQAKGDAASLDYTKKVHPLILSAPVLLPPIAAAAMVLLLLRPCCHSSVSWCYYTTVAQCCCFHIGATAVTMMLLRDIPAVLLLLPPHFQITHYFWFNALHSQQSSKWCMRGAHGVHIECSQKQ